jgi:hypothetical protein
MKYACHHVNAPVRFLCIIWQRRNPFQIPEGRDSIFCEYIVVWHWDVEWGNKQTRLRQYLCSSSRRLEYDRVRGKFRRSAASEPIYRNLGLTTNQSKGSCECEWSCPGESISEINWILLSCLSRQRRMRWGEKGIRIDIGGYDFKVWWERIIDRGFVWLRFVDKILQIQIQWITRPGRQFIWLPVKYQITSSAKRPN